MRRPTIAVILAALISISACSKPGASGPAAPASVPGGPANPLLDAATYAPALNVDLNAMTKSASGLYYRDLTVGTGAAAAVGQQVAAKYSGRLTDGTEFDAGTYPFQLGARRVIAGWDEGLVGMRIGGKRQLVIPPDLAYGPAGSGRIGPNAILIFTVELVALQ